MKRRRFLRAAGGLITGGAALTGRGTAQPETGKTEVQSQVLITSAASPLAQACAAAISQSHKV